MTETPNASHALVTSENAPTVASRARAFVRDLRARDTVRFWLICAALVAGAWKLQAVLLAVPRQFPDSHDYLAPTSFLGMGGGVEVAGRLPGIPVFFFLLARNPRTIVVGQAILGATSWGVLACVLARRFRSSIVGLVVGIAVLVFSLTAVAALWDAVLLSESLSISVLVLLVAVSIRLFERPTTSMVVAAVTLGGIWVFVRDPNAEMLGFAAVTMAALALARLVPRRALVVAVTWIVLAVSSLALQSASMRWELALYDIIGTRILTDRDATREFARDGMPVTPAVKTMAGKLASEGFESRSQLAGLRVWTREHGREAYLRYLLRNPGSTVLDPFRDPSCRAAIDRGTPCFNVLRDGGRAPLESYPARHWRSPFPTLFEDAISQRLNMSQYVAALLFCLVAGVLGLWRGQRRGNWGWSIWLAFASVVFLVFGWNAETQEVARHTVDAWIYVTLGVYVTLGTLADEVIPVCPGQTSQPARPVSGRACSISALRRGWRRSGRLS